MLKSAQTIVDVQADPAAVATKVARWLVELIAQSKDDFSICLSGGSTPKLLYETLAGKAFCEQIPWNRIHWFWGDERYVRKDDPLSNYRMVEESLLKRAPIPSKNIHAVRTDVQDPKHAAGAYEQTLKTYYGANRLDPERPLFHVTFLGLGPDGHTASLFPGSAVLNERLHWVEAVIGVKPEARITLTYPALESSGAVAFLVTGREKRDIARRVLTGGDLPAARIRPKGPVYWFFDQAAHPEN
jgi:6-phosphogluconolactonase